MGHVLVQNRTSTGVSALYASRLQLVINASQAGNSLQRLLNHAGYYRANHPTPNFSPRNGVETLASLRNLYFRSHTEQPETWANGAAAAAIRFAQDRHYKHVERVARPGDQTPAWLKPWVAGLQY